MFRTIREIGKVLASAEHPKRMVRCTDSDPRNIPYRRMNKLGEFIVKLTGGWDD